ncbi:MAG: 5-formyltetrahydrofolate cyclo-ligase [Clostridia bacterium]|nr:5-formyltetrahydrofolate cyclo-ligase [Clostridia bacterium]
MTKAEIRKEKLKLRRAMNSEQVSAFSEQICSKIRNTSEFSEAQNICLYSPINNEVDVMLLKQDIIKCGKNMWLPKVVGKEMIFILVDENTEFECGSFGIKEPKSGKILEKADNSFLVIMPGSVFTSDRKRIGYGGGYYDRFLSENSDCKKLAAAYEIQIADDIPSENHDIRPDKIITENSIY